jgi:hypothetical protein
MMISTNLKFYIHLARHLIRCFKDGSDFVVKVILAKSECNVSLIMMEKRKGDDGRSLKAGKSGHC